MINYEISPWVVVLVVVLAVWRAFHGPYSNEWWEATTRWLRRRLLREMH